MEVSFLNVSGECFLTEALTCEEPCVPYAGLTWRGMGPCVLITGPTGVATIAVNSRRFELGPISWVKLGNSVGGIHRFLPQGKDVRHVVGHLWALVSRDPNFEEDYNANVAVGVRG